MNSQKGEVMVIMMAVMLLAVLLFGGHNMGMMHHDSGPANSPAVAQPENAEAATATAQPRPDQAVLPAK